ncbi:MAG: restriction endonuclease subunit S, partial [Pseudomonadales bacterium]
DGELDWSDLVYSNDENEIAKYVLKSGDVLFNRTNSPALVGKTAIYQGEHKAIYAGYLIRIVAGPDLLPEYLNYALNSPEGRAFSWRVKSDGVSQSNISAAKLRGFEFSVPPLDEQKEIVSRIASAFEKIDRLTAKANRALELTDKLDEAILARAFRGELVPQYPNDEPASILLERILAERAAAPKVKRVRKTTRAKRESLQMAKSVIEVLNATDGWLEAPKLFEACGVRDGSLTEEVEEIYKQLLLLERQEKIAIEPVYDTAGEAKVTDRVRLLE